MVLFPCIGIYQSLISTFLFIVRHPTQTFAYFCSQFIVCFATLLVNPITLQNICMQFYQTDRFIDLVISELTFSLGWQAFADITIASSGLLASSTQSCDLGGLVGRPAKPCHPSKKSRLKGGYINTIDMTRVQQQRPCCDRFMCMMEIVMIVTLYYYKF